MPSPWPPMPARWPAMFSIVMSQEVFSLPWGLRPGNLNTNPTPGASHAPALLPWVTRQVLGVGDRLKTTTKGTFRVRRRGSDAGASPSLSEFESAPPPPGLREANSGTEFDLGRGAGRR